MTSLYTEQRVLGLLGGMSWESTAEYYRQLNRGVTARLGGLHSTQLLLYSVDFAGIAAAQADGHWERASALLCGAAERLANAGAGAILLCTNTMHEVAEAITAAVTVPLLHIVDPTGAALTAAGVRRAALLGTRFTMERPFWRSRLEGRFGIALDVPDAESRAEVHRIIYDELCRGELRPTSRASLARIMHALAARGAEAIILGCTELALLVASDDAPVPIFDTTALHAEAGVNWLLEQARLGGDCQ